MELDFHTLHIIYNFDIIILFIKVIDHVNVENLFKKVII